MGGSRRNWRTDPQTGLPIRAGVASAIQVGLPLIGFTCILLGFLVPRCGMKEYTIMGLGSFVLAVSTIYAFGQLAGRAGAKVASGIMSGARPAPVIDASSGERAKIEKQDEG